MRINATRGEHMRRRQRALAAVDERRARYAQPGVWEAERAALQGDLDAAAARGDEVAVRAARNALAVHGLYRPRGEG
jgi:hypothetical protein